jgi:hypothetical protein
VKLSDEQLLALRNLSKKKAGAVVGWIDIAAARGLTDLGLAIRNAGGWQITPDGQEALLREDRVIEVENVVAMQRRPPSQPHEFAPRRPR